MSNPPTDNNITSQPAEFVVGSIAESMQEKTPFESLTLESVSKSRDTAHLVELAEDLRAITTTTEKPEKLIEQFLDAISTRARMFACGWIELSGGKKPEIIESRFKNPAMDNSAMRKQMLSAAIYASAHPGPQILKCDNIRGSLVACVSFYKNDKTTAVMCGVFHDDKSRCAEAMMICQSVANHFDVWRSREQLTTMAMEVRSTATVLELVGKAEGSESVKDACVKIANELQNLFRCEYVAIGLKGPTGTSATSSKLVAVSSMAEFDNQSRTCRLLKSAFDESIMRGQYTVFPEGPAADSAGPRSIALSHKKLANQMRCEAAISVPLRNEANKTIGAITFLGKRSLDRTDYSRNLIRALEHPVGSTVEVVRRAEGGWLRKLSRMLVSKDKSNKKWIVGSLAIASLVAMFIPVPYRVNSKCTAEPVTRSFSVAPHKGLLENTFAEPGDVVAVGQVLAKMDGREIGFQMASTIADRNRAAKDFDTYRAAGEIAKSLQADLEMKGFEAELSVLEFNQNNLEIKSQIEGVVLSGSIDKRQNYPVDIGQKLYEIAPITPLRVELAIPADEVMHIEAGQTVKFRFDGFGTETIEAVVEKIRPSSTIRDDENVFIAEAILNNEDGRVRPGMDGHAKVYGTKRTLGWAIFHRPWEKIVTAVGF